MSCRSCGRTVAGAAGSCAFCGAPVAGEDRLTVAPADPTVLPPGSPHSPTATSSPVPTRTLPPGALLGNRYRIHSQIGQGGMGDVYRADDLVLDQPVALKFLPAAVVHDADRLGRFRAEVRVARQISHPNVCRVYDIAAADGYTFLTMEYIDGENLAVLLRRIGRLPHDTAATMARQLCAGLAAAHDKNVLHRDLKPANVMIDGTGKVKLADFGLAAMATDPESSALAGTPAYMAPELFDRQPPSTRSDIYALGLVLYEMFGGKPAFQSTSVAELARLHREATPTSLSNVVSDADASVGRLIERCIAKDPAERPASALLVAAALPGGDPLAAALAAGETPSPQVVAAAGGVGTVAPLVGAACVAGILLGLATIVWLSRTTQAVHYAPLDKAPEVLFDHARSMLGRLQFTDPPFALASGFASTGYVSYLSEHDPSPTRWQKLRAGQPPEYVYWYRQSPRELVTDRLSLGGRITSTDPPNDVPGMLTVRLDPKGRLHQLVAMPAAQQPPAPGQLPDWLSLFREAGLDLSQFTPVTSTWTPPAYADTRAAWDGVYPENPDMPIHVEAAAVAGRPTFFRIYRPWDRPDDASTIRTPALIFILPLVVFAGAALLARRNIRLGRGDQAGATRLALILCVVHVMAGLLGAAPTIDVAVFPRTLTVLAAAALARGAMAWVIYMAVEPDLRRLLPDLLISWSRLLGGRVWDPLIGRDILIGLTAGVASQILWQLNLIAPKWIGGAPDLTVLVPASTIRVTAATLLGGWTSAVLATTSYMLVVLVLHLLVRRRTWVGPIVFALFAALAMSGNIGVSTPFMLLGLLLLTIVITRYGLVAMVVLGYVNPVLDHVPMTLDRDAWYAPQSWLVLATIVALAIFAYRTAVAGRPLFVTAPEA